LIFGEVFPQGLKQDEIDFVLLFWVAVIFPLELPLAQLI